MKNVLIILLFLATTIFAESRVHNKIEQEILTCLHSQVVASDIYNAIYDKNFKNHAELDKIINYRNTLIKIADDCYKIFIFREDALNARKLSIEVELAIEMIRHNMAMKKLEFQKKKLIDRASS